MSSAAPSTSNLELLLADYDHRPALEKGLPEIAAGKAPKPEKAPRGVDGMSLEAPDADPNDLSLQRWGIIIPKSAAGERALEAISPLLALRQSEQEAKVQVFRVEPGMDLQRSLDWKNQVLRNENLLPESERPKFLLILGDLDEVSAELGHVLANGSFVGRIHFDTPAGYEAYARKVVRWEKDPSTSSKAIAKFFVANDGTSATMQGQSHLITPCLDLARKTKTTRRPFPAELEDPIANVYDAADFIERCKTDQPSILLSVCHGAGRSQTKPWKGADEQRQFQGALQISLDNGRDGWVTAERMQDATFLPGGLWFALACFGAGTPSRSAFYPWLKTLDEAGDFDAPVSNVLRSLPAEGEKPFLAAMPKAALANPNGPLAVIGHLDLAWTYGFVDPNRMSQSRASRIFSALNVMANGSRSGVALDALMRAYREVNDELLSGYQAEEDARVWSRSYNVDPASRAHSFMLRNDLRGYVLLGDPAARLPLARKTTATQPIPSTGGHAADAQASASTSRDPNEMERAVLAVLAQDGTTKEVAKKHGASREELEGWVETYKAAGKAALGKLC